MAKDKTTIDPINDSFENVVDSIAQPAPPIFNKNKGLGGNLPSEPAPPKQIALDLGWAQAKLDSNQEPPWAWEAPYIGLRGYRCIFHLEAGKSWQGYKMRSRRYCRPTASSPNRQKHHSVW